MSSSTPHGAWYGAAALGALGLVAAPGADAQVIFTDVDDVTLVDKSDFPIDFDGDGDFELSVDAGTTSAAGDYSPALRLVGVDDGADAIGNGAVANTAFGYQYLLPLSEGSSIGGDNIATTASFEFGPSFTFDGGDPNNWIGAGDKYLGIQISLDDGTDATLHFAWVNVEVVEAGSIIVKGFAYESEPGTIITAGDVGVVAADPDALAEGFLFSEVAPNPVSGRSTFDLAVGQAETVSADLFDTLGRKVQTLFSGALTPGTTQSVELTSSELPSGVYVVRVTGESFVTTRNVTIVR